MLHGTKVLGTFAPEERQFHRSESSKERMFHGTKVPREQKFSLGSFRSRERKCRGTKRPGIVWASVQPHFANCAANWIVCAAHCTNRAAHLMKQRCLFLWRAKNTKRLRNVYGDENLGMDGISDKVKRDANFLGYICGKWGIATFCGKSVVRGK